MSTKPLYRLQSIGQPGIHVGEDYQQLVASIRIPDILPVGSRIHIEYDFAPQKGDLTPPNGRAACWLSVVDGGRLKVRI